MQDDGEVGPGPEGAGAGRGDATLSAFWGELVACGGDLPRVLDLIVRRVADVVGEAAVLTVLAGDGEQLVPVASHHADPAMAAAMKETTGSSAFAVGEGIVGRVALDRRSAMLNGLAPEVIGEMVQPPARAFVREHPIRALLIVPMVASGELVGTLGVVRLESAEPYTREDEVAITAMAERAATAIHDAQEHPTQLGAVEYEAMYRNSADGILFTAPDGRVLAANPAACRILGLSEREICGRGREGLLLTDDRATQLALAERSRVGSVRAEVPMRRGNGALFRADITSAVFATPSGELRTCVIFRDVTVQAAERNALVRQAEALAAASERDPLTGLYNQRGFLGAGSEALAVARREGRAAQLAYLDLDGFKAVNDTYGHRIGDIVLRRLGRAIATVTRESDVSARVGGDELVVLLLSASDRDAEEVIGRLTALLDETSEEHLPSVEFSVGIVEFDPAGDEALEALVERADREMYKMKARRRFSPG